VKYGSDLLLDKKELQKPNLHQQGAHKGKDALDELYNEIYIKFLYY
jgi:hypothetical protein